MIVILIFLGLALAVLLYSRFVEPFFLINQHHTYPAQSDVSPCTIVFFSDTHFGKHYPEAHIKRLVAAINQNNPDLVLFGGDFLDRYSRDQDTLSLVFLQNALSELKANVGCYGVFGNHDMKNGSETCYAELMAASGITLLENETRFIEALNLNLTGYADYLFGGSPSQGYTLAGDTFNLIVSHEPDVAKRIDAQTPGVLFAGHSHGGQIAIPLLSRLVLPEGARHYVRGLYPKVGRQKNLTLWVSKGIGMTSLPLRLFAPPEILVLKIEHEKKTVC